MDQKNTIVKCKAYPDCLFNHNGVCDNYVINISADGKCESYVETASENEIIYENAKKTLKEAGVTLVEPKGEVKRGQQAKCDFYEDGWINPEIVNEICQPFTMSDHICDYEPFLTKAICSQCKYNTHGNLLCSRKNVASNGIWTCWEKKE